MSKERIVFQFKIDDNGNANFQLEGEGMDIIMGLSIMLGANEEMINIFESAIEFHKSGGVKEFIEGKNKYGKPKTEA